MTQLKGVNASLDSEGKKGEGKKKSGCVVTEDIGIQVQTFSYDKEIMTDEVKWFGESRTEIMEGTQTEEIMTEANIENESHQSVGEATPERDQNI